MSIVLNGVTFGNATRKGPSGGEMTPEKIGVLLPAADGTRNWVQRSVKRTWKYEWDGISESLRDDIYAIFSLTTTFSHTDIHGDTAMCQCESNDYGETISAILVDGTCHYRVSLTVREA
ncbi:MAG: hypothetical protein IPP13_21665 [Kouleothrix sp.]|jgi:hypothetical protein|nr:hypothetical protein [Kouleothrix sp.]